MSIVSKRQHQPRVKKYFNLRLGRGQPNETLIYLHLYNINDLPDILIVAGNVGDKAYNVNDIFGRGLDLPFVAKSLGEDLITGRRQINRDLSIRDFTGRIYQYTENVFPKIKIDSWLKTMDKRLIYNDKLVILAPQPDALK